MWEKCIGRQRIQKDVWGWGVGAVPNIISTLPPVSWKAWETLTGQVKYPWAVYVLHLALDTADTFGFK